MKHSQHPAILAFGVTTVEVFLLLAEPASARHEELYHFSGPVSRLLLPVLLNFVSIGLILTLVLLWARKSSLGQRIVYPILGIGVPWMILKDGFAINNGREVPTWVGLIFLALVLAGGIFLALASHRDGHIIEKAKNLELSLLACLAFASMLPVGQALFFCWQARNLNPPPVLHHSVSPSLAKRRRIVWVVLDELSYLQTYEQRYPGLKLPEFDRLASGATVFTHAVPAGQFTEMVFPALMTGTPVDDIKFSAAGTSPRLKAANGDWRTLDPHRTVFQDALNSGYTTSVAGFFNPYCRILPDVLDHCFWAYHQPLPAGMESDASVLHNAIQPLLLHIAGILRRLHKGKDVPQRFELFDHQSNYRELVSAGDQFLYDPSVNFILLHLPIPHPDGIYRRDTASFSTLPSSYIDNLALCDIYLAHLRQVLEDTGGWDNTTVVLMGDHSWRTWMWSIVPQWTPEDQSASHGDVYDERPVYIVKLAGQTAPQRIETPFAAIRTRSLFDALFAGRINTPQQLAEWAAQDGTAEKH